MYSDKIYDNLLLERVIDNPKQVNLSFSCFITLTLIIYDNETRLMPVETLVKFH